MVVDRFDLMHEVGYLFGKTLSYFPDWFASKGTGELKFAKSARL